MTYYFISFDDSKFEAFLDRFPFLNSGIWIRSEEDLKNALSNEDDGQCFILDHSEDQEMLDHWTLIIRDNVPAAKIIIVNTELNPSEIKAHQLSPYGGDAYVSKNVDGGTLERILSGVTEQITNLKGNKLESTDHLKLARDFNLNSMRSLKDDSRSIELDRIFQDALPKSLNKPKFQSLDNLVQAESEESELDIGVEMSDKDNDLSLDNLEELELSDLSDSSESVEESGLSLEMDSLDDLSLSEEEDSVTEEEEALDPGEISLDFSEAVEDEHSDLSESADDSALVLEDGTAAGLDFGPLDGEISPDAQEKLAEIDAIMEEDSKVTHMPDLSLMEDAADLVMDSAELSFSEQTDEALDIEEKADEIHLEEESFEIADLPAAGDSESIDSDLDQPLVSDDLDLANLDFGAEENVEASSDEASHAEFVIPKEERTQPRKRLKKEKEEVTSVASERPVGQELREISGAYSAELERMQATVSNLRSDREEILKKLDSMEEEKVLYGRNTLSLRAELDEKKIELSIVRKKLNEDISELKDRIRLEEERRLILEEKNRVLREEIDKSAQRSKIDVKKIQLRERELEQRLELLKADSETQIRNRDLKILELKRKIDGMEFDMESMQSQEKRTVESRFELEDKLEKAIKTLRNAISVLEDEPDKGPALEALKKNINM